MPKCWFVLLRFWLRVDRVLVRLYETRLLGSLHRAAGAPLVTRELRRSEGTFEQLRSAGAPPAGVRCPFSTTVHGVLLCGTSLQTCSHVLGQGVV